MLSINGIYDGKRIIPTEPLPLGEGTCFKVIITFLEPIEAKETNSLNQFCGIWEDDRDAQEIVAEIYKERENFKFREVEL
jgi:hypothetical protein